MQQSSLVNNNLAGKGPLHGPREMRFVGVIRDYQGAPVDLVISATSAYQASNIRQTRLKGRSGQINVAGGSSVDLNFRFVKSTTNVDAWLPKFAFTFSDLDQGRWGRARKTVEVEGFDRFVVAADHELAIKNMTPQRMSFSSTKYGHFCDNPRHPLQLREVKCKGHKVDQAKRSVMLVFTNTHSFNATFRVGKSRRGRLLVFAGLSSLAPECSSTTGTQCTDTRSDWSDDFGNKCDKYASLSNGNHCTKHGHEDYGKGPANVVCCTCGGGMHVGTGASNTASIRKLLPASLVEGKATIPDKKQGRKRQSKFLAPNDLGLTLTQATTFLFRKPSDSPCPNYVDEL